jgi:hypothetical protein
MEWILIALIALALFILSVRAFKLLSWITIVGGFIAIVAAGVYWQGFPEGLIGGLIMGTVFAVLVWWRFKKAYEDAQKAQAWRIARSRRIKHPIVCARCGWKLPYVRIPRSFRQLIWGGWTCSNCGAELDYSGKEIIRT